MVLLSKQQKVLDFLHSVDGEFIFGYTDEDTQEEIQALALSNDEFIDFGEPKHLTLTIEPGDLLN